MAAKPSPGQTLLQWWQWLSHVPAGRWLFSRLLAWRVPYTGSIKSQLLNLQPGYCQASLVERRALRNHLNSIHAIALANLGEMTSGLAMLTGLAPDVRGIVVNISTEYFKKARGTLIAESRCDIPAVTEDLEYKVYADIYDSQQSLVARTTVTWRLGLITA